MVDEELPETDDTFWPEQAEGISSDLLDRINIKIQKQLYII